MFHISPPRTYITKPFRDDTFLSGKFVAVWLEQKHTMSVLSIPEPRKRKFLPEEFRVTVWSKLKPYYSELERRDISDVSSLERWIYDWNEINALVREEINWRYIRLSINMNDEDTGERYNYIVQRVLPKVIEVDHALNVKLLESPFKSELNREQFGVYLRGIENSLTLYRPENIPLTTEIKVKSKAYGKIGCINGNQSQWEKTKHTTSLQTSRKSRRKRKGNCLQKAGGSLFGRGIKAGRFV